MFDPRKINRFPGIIGGAGLVVPTWPVELDTTSPLAASMGYYGLGSAAGKVPWTNFVDLRKPITLSGLSSKNSPLGPATNFTSSSYANFGSYVPMLTSIAGGAGDFTMGMFGNPPTGCGESHALQQRSITGPENQAGLIFGISYVGSGLSGAAAIGIYAGTSFGASSAAGVTDGQFHWWIGTRINGVYAIYKDSVNITYSSANSSASPFNGNSAFNVNTLGPNNLGILGAAMICPVTFVANTGWTATQISAFISAPFAMLRPIIRRQYYGAASLLTYAPSWQLDLT